MSKQQEGNVKDIKPIFTIGETTHYNDGHYTVEEKVGNGSNIKIVGSIYEYGDIVSVQFNQLKAKLFNIVDGIFVADSQKKALKGLIKGFCNDNYWNTIGDIEGWLERIGFKVEKSVRTAPKEEGESSH